jgi:hypothetical protein
MIAALINGERDPQVLAEPAKGRLPVKRAALVEALTGRFDEHHAELADMLLDQIERTDRTPRCPHRAADRRHRRCTSTAGSLGR